MSRETSSFWVPNCLPHLAITYLLHRAGLETTAIAEQYAGVPLRVLLERVQELNQQGRYSQPNRLGVWLRFLRKNMKRKLKDLVWGKAERQRYRLLLNRKVGETTLVEYLGSCSKNEMKAWDELVNLLADLQAQLDGIERVTDELDEAASDLILVARELEGQNGAFAILMARHGKAVTGMIRAGVDSDADVADICQKTWIKVREKLPMFNPTKGPFEAMVKFWAGLMIRRYWAGKGPNKPTPFSDLQGDYPDDGQEADVEGIIADRAGTAGSIAPADHALAEEFDRLLRLTFVTNSPPHQLLAFLAAKLLDWDPAEIVQAISDTPLLELAAWLKRELLEIYGEHDAVVIECFTHLESVLQPRRTVAEVVGAARTRKTYRHLLDHAVSGTTLRDYYTADPSAADYAVECAENITNWGVSVQRRVFQAQGDDGEGMSD